VHLVPTGANRHDASLLAATLTGLDQGYAGGPTRALLDELGLEGAIARKGVPAPRQAGSHWTVERVMGEKGERRRTGGPRLRCPETATG